ncbi:hypothetical protein C1646_670223 [Rhizophagus diaphanus]|nr:hypothetical protein C1646_670223 [Rhizophagus diaphanus] [Rhizophagus sp. MUCL 43196]
MYIKSLKILLEKLCIGLQDISKAQADEGLHSKVQWYNDKDERKEKLKEFIDWKSGRNTPLIFKFENGEEVFKNEFLSAAKDTTNRNKPYMRYICIINLQISGDGRNVERKVKHVIITVAILDDKNTSHKPDHHYTTIFYPGCEDYNSLSNAMTQFYHELRNLKEGLFLAICLGFNSAHSKNFCPWCTIDKSQQEDLSKEWKISKEIDKLVEQNNYFKGHIGKPLFDMLPLNHWVPDELHIMLRITDCLWSLVIAELTEYGQKTNAEEFQNDAKNWLTLFLMPSEEHHVSKFMTIHQKWGLKSFSCSAVEKKIISKVSYFFRKTMKDRGRKSKSSAIIEILENEIDLFFTITIMFP